MSGGAAREAALNDRASTAAAMARREVFLYIESLLY